MTVPGVINIESLWTSTDGVKMMYGNAFYRPFETFHVTTRKFLEQVFIMAHWARHHFSNVIVRRKYSKVTNTQRCRSVNSAINVM